MEMKVSSHHLKSALLCQAKRDVRFYLNGIYFDSDRTLAATNGHILFTGSYEGTNAESLIVAVRGVVPSKFFHEAVFTIEDGQTDGEIRYIDGSGFTVDKGWFEVIDGRFPITYKDVCKCIPEATGQIGLNAEYLGLAVKIAKQFNPKFSAIVLTMQGSNKSAVIDFKGIDQDRGRLVIMPMRV